MGARGDTEKLRNLILYLSKKSENDSKFGSMKLNKLLFFIDFYFYRRTGKSLTGEIYQKIQKGPAPKAMLPLLDEMKSAGELDLIRGSYFGFLQRRPHALREPDLSVFSNAELEIADEVIERFKGHNGTEISKEAYEEFNIKSFSEKESIPYTIALVDYKGFTPEELEWARENERELAGTDNAGGQAS